MSEGTLVRTGMDRTLLAIVAGALGLVIVGLAVVLLAGRQPAPPPADPATPVGVVQAYVTAISEGDAARAYSYLSRSAQSTQTLAEYRRAFPPVVRPSNSEQRVVIEPVSESQERGEVRVTISTFSTGGGPFATGTFHREVMVRLVNEDGQWRIDQPVEPYPFLY